MSIVGSQAKTKGIFLRFPSLKDTVNGLLNPRFSRGKLCPSPWLAPLRVLVIFVPQIEGFISVYNSIIGGKKNKKS
jgi:hypothetical protein